MFSVKNSFIWDKKNVLLDILNENVVSAMNNVC